MIRKDVIWKFQPFTTDKSKFGIEYNSHISLVPNSEDWILLLDYDCMILTPKTYEVIEAAIRRYPETLVFGAMTNRVGVSYQRLTGAVIDENDSIRHHIKIAEQQAEKYKDGDCKQNVKFCAGFFLLFRKSYWEKHKFQERIIDKRGAFFDYNFTRPAGNVKGGVKIIRGAYVFHSYRLNKSNIKDKSHLK